LSEQFLKLTTFGGERDRTGDRFTADALIDLYERHEIRYSLLLRGAEGFGLRHHLQTDRLLTLSEDLPVMSVAYDTPERIDSILEDVEALAGHGLTTIERVPLAGEGLSSTSIEEEAPDPAKLTILLGRKHKVDGRPAHIEVVETLKSSGVEGASVLLGVDGTVRGKRSRARFFGANPDVPVMVVAVGATNGITKAVTRLSGLLPDALMTVERVKILKRDGRLVDQMVLPASGATMASDSWQKLTVYAGEQTRHDGRPLHPQIVRRLRDAGAIGATTVRGIWGYHGDHEPHGDSIWSIRRRVPVVSVVIDEPARCLDWFEVINELTDDGGLVTVEKVPCLKQLPKG